MYRFFSFLLSILSVASLVSLYFTATEYLQKKGGVETLEQTFFPSPKKEIASSTPRIVVTKEAVPPLSSVASLTPKKKIVVPAKNVPTVKHENTLPKVAEITIIKTENSTTSTSTLHVPITPQVVETLTSEGILEWTNYYREQNGLSPLVVNKMLVQASKVKTEDMLTRQYFEHVSPLGKDASDLVKNEGYDYLLVGENLAYGNFRNSKDLVDAWMASPGHRANILKVHYEEIGIYAIQGNYQGHTVWMSVQEFGRPTSSCPLPSKTEKEVIDQSKIEFDTLSLQATTYSSQMSTYQTQGDFASSNNIVPLYNDLVGRINLLVEKIRVMVDTYNEKINTYKLCAELTN